MMNQIWKKKVCLWTVAAALTLAAAGTALADGTSSVAVAGAAQDGGAGAAAASSADTFVPGTSVNGLGVSGMTVQEAADRIAGFYASEYKLTVKERGGKSEIIPGSEIGFAVGLPEGFLQSILDQQNAAGRPSGPDVDNRYRTDMANTFNADALSGKVQSLGCISGDVVTTADAHVSGYEEGQPFVIIPEVRGNNVYPDKVAEVVGAAVAAGSTEVDLEAAGCYYEVQVTSDSPQLA